MVCKFPLLKPKAKLLKKTNCMLLRENVTFCGQVLLQKYVGEMRDYVGFFLLGEEFAPLEVNFIKMLKNERAT